VAVHDVTLTTGAAAGSDRNPDSARVGTTPDAARPPPLPAVEEGAAAASGGGGGAGMDTAGGKSAVAPPLPPRPRADSLSASASTSPAVTAQSTPVRRGSGSGGDALHLASGGAGGAQESPRSSDGITNSTSNGSLGTNNFLCFASNAFALLWITST